MSFNITEEENYVLVQLKSVEATPETIKEIDEQFNKSFSYIIFDLEMVSYFPEDFMDACSTWNSELVDQHILLVMAGLNKDTIQRFDDYGITGIPTVDESVDFIFMDQLEKELGEDLE